MKEIKCCFCNRKSFSLVYNKAIIYLRGKCRIKVIKRDGRAVDFDQEKIRIAISKANQEVKPRERATKEQIKEMIQVRDELQEKSGYYKIYPQTKVIDVTNCKSAKESEKLVLGNIKEAIIVGN